MPKAFRVLLESELHGGELNQGMGCDLMGMRGPEREGEHSSPRSHAGSAPGASSHPSPGQASPLGAAQRDFTPGAPPEGCMDGAAPGLAPFCSPSLHPTPLGRWRAISDGPSRTFTFQVFWTKWPLSGSHRWQLCFRRNTRAQSREV